MRFSILRTTVTLLIANSTGLMATAARADDNGVPTPHIDKNTSAELKKDAKKVGHAVGHAYDKAKETLGLKNPDTYTLDGTLLGLEGEHIKVARPPHPVALLEWSSATRFTLDGKAVAASQLPAGVPVKAHFDLDGSRVLAVEVEAKTP